MDRDQLVFTTQSPNHIWDQCMENRPLSHMRPVKAQTNLSIHKSLQSFHGSHTQRRTVDKGSGHSL